MIDDRGNECPYDFKNIQFYHENTEMYHYTFDVDGVDVTIYPNNQYVADFDRYIRCQDNIIKKYIKDSDNEFEPAQQ